jgi:hypothetical protein
MLLALSKTVKILGRNLMAHLCIGMSQNTQKLEISERNRIKIHRFLMEHPEENRDATPVPKSANGGDGKL